MQVTHAASRKRRGEGCDRDRDNAQLQVAVKAKATTVWPLNEQYVSVVAPSLVEDGPLQPITTRKWL